MTSFFSSVHADIETKIDKIKEYRMSLVMCSPCINLRFKIDQERYKVNLVIVLIIVLILSTYSLSFGADIRVLDSIAMRINSKSSSWFPVLQSYAMSLFKILLIIDVIWLGIQAALKREELMEIIASFARLVIFASIMLVLVVYYKDWTRSIISGLANVASSDLGALDVNPSSVFSAGLALVNTALDQVSILKSNSFGMLFCAIIICVIFSLISAQMLLIKCEAYIVLNAGAILLGFGGSAFTKNYAINFLRYSLSVAVKLFVMQLLISIGMDFMTDFSSTPADFNELTIVIGASIVLLALVNSIPDIVSGIINGSHVSTGSAITGAATAVATSTMAAMAAIKSAGVGGFQGASAVKGAYDYAKATGAAGPVGVASHMAGTLGKAAFGAQDPGTMAKINSAVQTHFESFKMTKGEGSGDPNE